MTTMNSPTDSQANLIACWIERNPDELARWIRRALDAFLHDTAIRLPRTDQERTQGFMLWLLDYRDRLREKLSQTLAIDVPRVAAEIETPQQMREAFDLFVWPKVEPEVRLYAIRGLAASWAIRNLGDAVILKRPERRNRSGRFLPARNGELRSEEYWHVPLTLSGIRGSLGHIVLDSNGEIVRSRTTSREELLRKANAAGTLHSAAAR